MASTTARRACAAALAAMLLGAAHHGRTEESAETVPPSDRAIEALRLLDSEDLYQRQLGFLRLEALREPGTADAIRRYLDHRDPETRAYSLRALAAIEGAQSVPLLLGIVQTDPDPAVRRAALLGLEPLQPSSPDILPMLIRALKDRSSEVRMAAADIVSRVDEPQAREAILKRYRRERRQDVRRVLDMAMKRLDNP